MSDLVERLRGTNILSVEWKSAVDKDGHEGLVFDVPTLASEAAEEIERLWAQRDDLATMIRRMARLFPKDDVLRTQALALLSKHGLLGSILRTEDADDHRP